MTHSLHVLIAACGQPEALRQTLHSLAACAKPASYAGTIVVENGPRAGLDQVVAEFPSAHQFSYQYSQPPNKSLALNRVLAGLSDSLVVFTDDDVSVQGQTLAAYANHAAGKSGGEFYGGPIVPRYEEGPPPAWLVPLLPRTAGGWRMPVDKPAEIQQPEFVGPNFAAFAAEILRVGGFDARLGPGAHLVSPGEDTEIQARLLAAGVRGYYLPDAEIHHRVQRRASGVEFAVHRAERNGIYWGIDRARRRGFAPRGWLKVYGQWLNDRLRIRRWRRGGEEPLRVRAECLAARWRGRWRGIQLGWNWDRQAPWDELTRAAPHQRRAA